MAFRLGLLVLICMYVNLSMCVQLFLKRGRERDLYFDLVLGAGYLRERERERERESIINYLIGPNNS